MKISDILRHKGASVVTIGPEDSVRSLLALLAKHNVGALVAVDSDQVVGIISERDIVRRLDERGEGALAANVSDLMTASVVSCAPDDSVDKIAETMIPAANPAHARARGRQARRHRHDRRRRGGPDQAARTRPRPARAVHHPGRIAPPSGPDQTPDPGARNERRAARGATRGQSTGPTVADARVIEGSGRRTYLAAVRPGNGRSVGRRAAQGGRTRWQAPAQNWPEASAIAPKSLADGVALAVRLARIGQNRTRPLHV